MILGEYLTDLAWDYCKKCPIEDICKEYDCDCPIMEFIDALPELVGKDFIYKVCLYQLKSDYDTVIATIDALEKLIKREND